MRNFLLFIPFAVLLASCAVIVSPSGGEKDVAPPHVVDYNPDSAAINFNSKRIVIRFNEYVQLSDLNNQLIVSPQMSEQPDVTIRKKEIVIDLPDSLLPNTTYTISFGTAIRDITENNVLDNFRYVFSTGPDIDSLRLSGKLLNASTLSSEKSVLVMLYRSAGDSVPYKERPYYFTKTKADGSFTLNNLKAGTYKVFALEDKNQNYLYDNTDERIAFSDSLINLRTNNDSLTLKLFRELPSSQKRMSLTQPTTGHIAVVYALPIRDLQITTSFSGEEQKNLFTEKSRNNDSINFWLGTVTSDSVTIVIRDGKTLVDSLELELERPGKKKNSGRGGENLDAKRLRIATNISGSQTEPGKKLQVNINNPVKELKTDLVFLLHGKDTMKTSLSLSENRRVIYFANTAFLEDSSYTVLLKPGAITDWFGQKSDTLLQKFHVRPATDYGALKTVLNGLPEGHYILQLLNEKGTVLQDTLISGPATVSFQYVSSGGYALKLIRDDNQNGKWDTGNYLLHRQPEMVSYYTKPIRMRTGWDMDVEWNFK